MLASSPDQVPSLNLIGAGRVGRTLGHLWHRQGFFAIQDVLTTSLTSAEQAVAEVGAGQALADMQAMRDADAWMLAVPDAQIVGMAQTLAAHAAQRQATGRRPAIVFHCSGALGSELLAPLRALGWQAASAHCILSFASVAAAIAQFPGTACALEGDANALALLEKAFTTIAAHCFPIRAEDKRLYHAAAVFATNFLPVLQYVAEDLWRSTGVPEQMVLQLRSSLLHNAVNNLIAHGPQGALTGPAARGDVELIVRQGRAVGAWNTQAGAAYDALSALALQLKHGVAHKKSD